jgi:hypothetical protein
VVRRLAIVLWWLGALLFAFGILSALIGGEVAALVLFVFFPALCCLVIAFVLGGSFLRPPRLKE